MEVRRRGDKVGIGVTTLGEILAGIELSASREESLKITLRNLGMFVFWPFDREAAKHYAKIYAQLRRMGRPMQHIDMQLAPTAFSLGNCTVITYDTDLSAIPGLHVENWRNPDS